MATDLSQKTIAVLATDGFEQSELLEPVEALKNAGATVHIVSLEAGEIKGWNHTDWGQSVSVTKTVDEVSAEDYDGLMIPGGQINPDLLRINERAVEFVREFDRAEKPIASICHGPWVLIEAGIVEGRTMTSYPSIRTDLENAGADWVDEEVVVDNGIVTSRKPDDLPAFCSKMVEEMAEGRHPRRHPAGTTPR